MTHATNVNPNGTGSERPDKKPGAFQKIRRRLTVTGASPTLDGAASGAGPVSDTQHLNASRTNVNCAVNKYHGVSCKGHAPYNPSKKNQDALIMEEDPSTNTLILCVLDGHGEHGDLVAIRFQKSLAKDMMRHPAWKLDVKKAAEDAIDQIENRVCRDYGIDTEFSGTTLSMAIIRDNRITGVNIGDSRVIIGKDAGDGSGALIAEQFTQDHKPDTPKEKERIIRAGGRVFAVEYDDGIDGPPRVWLGHMDVPGLAMSRSLGDAVAHTAGVISTPEFTERDLDPATDKCVVLATDGLWEFVNNQETIDMTVAAGSYSKSVDVLVEEANKRWKAEEQVIDDTTVITASLFGYMNK